MRVPAGRTCILSADIEKTVMKEHVQESGIMKEHVQESGIIVGCQPKKPDIQWLS